MSEESNTGVAEYSGEWWSSRLLEVEKELDKKWRDEADRIVKRYLDDRDDSTDVGNMKKYNIFWANTQIMKSALYATPPKPVVKRQHDDAKDDVARTAALMLQRMLTFGINEDNSDMHQSFQNATEDRLIPGMGQVWLRYEVEVEKVDIPAVNSPPHPDTGEVMELMPATTSERIASEKVCTDYVHWRDFLWSPARTWEEVWWVARGTWMKKKAFKKRFSEDVYKDVHSQAEAAKATDGYPKGFEKGRIRVYEVWCEDTNKVYWINPGTKTLLDSKDDFLELKDFWPCPKPLLATHTTNDVTPRPDYMMVADQYNELDVLNDRISTLTKALRVVGAYDATNTELARMITGAEFAMIPVDKWAALAENGGIKGVVDWFPVDMIANVLTQLVNQRVLVVQQIYELTSISDIMRGGSNPRETLGAQKLKAQYSSVRLRITQQDVAKFVCQAMRLKAEIICKHYQPENIIKQSLIEQTESAQFAQPAIELLKDFDAMNLRVEVTEESLSMADYTAEREMRIAYLTAVGQFLSQAAAMVTGMPSALPYLIKMILWVTASFRGADDIESVLDDAAKAAMQLPTTPAEEKEEQKPPPPDPRVTERAKAEGQIAIDNNQARHRLTEIKAEGVKEIMAEPPPEPKGDGE